MTGRSKTTTRMKSGEEDESGDKDAGEHLASDHTKEHIDVDLLQR